MRQFGRKIFLVVAAAASLASPLPSILKAQTPLDRSSEHGQESGDLLGATFESESAGISVRIPKGCVRLRSTNAGDDVGQFGDPKRKWEFKVTRIMRDAKTTLVGTTDNFGKPIPGLLEQTVASLRQDLSGSTVLRQDLTNIADPGLGETKLVNNVGMIAIRYGAGTGHFLTQQAIIQASDRMFYLIALTSPVPDAQGPNVGPSESERSAVKTFRQMLDSVRLLDTSAIRAEQNDRLVRTRRILLEWKNKSRLHAILIPEQWLRVMRGGKDIGYSFITEQKAAGVPKPLKASEVMEGKNDSIKVVEGDGVLIGIRSRSITMPEVVVDGAIADADKPKGPVQIDNATWLYVSPDQKLEDWSRITVVDDGTTGKDGKPALRSIKEFGSSTIQTKTELDPDLLPGTKLDAKQPAAVIREHHRLDVTTITETGASDPLSQELPVFYVPQSTSHLLPRLLPLKRRSMSDVRTYYFATYVPETRQVMSRYVEVGDEGEFTFAGNTIHAIPVTDRLGWRGSVTTHYISREGRYLGSENKDTHTVIIPSDAATLTSIWRGANLTQPGAMPRPGAGPERPVPQPAANPVLGPAQPGR